MSMDGNLTALDMPMTTSPNLNIQYASHTKMSMKMYAKHVEPRTRPGLRPGLTPHIVELFKEPNRK